MYFCWFLSFSLWELWENPLLLVLKLYPDSMLAVVSQELWSTPLMSPPNHFITPLPSVVPRSIPRGIFCWQPWRSTTRWEVMRLPPPWVRLTTPPPWCLTTLGSSTGSRAHRRIQAASAWTGTHIWRRPGSGDDPHSWKSKFPISRMWTASTDGRGSFSLLSSPSSTSSTGCTMSINSTSSQSNSFTERRLHVLNLTFFISASADFAKEAVTHCVQQGDVYTTWIYKDSSADNHARMDTPDVDCCFLFFISAGLFFYFRCVISSNKASVIY